MSDYTGIVETSSTLIEGVSNDVLVLLVVFVLTSVAFVYWYKMFSRRNQVIHPSALDQVRATRNRVHDEREGQDGQSNGFRSNDDRCPICIDQLSYTVETNCGHTFCYTCIMSYWEHGAWINAMNCPVCRQEIRVLLTIFTHEEEVSDQALEFCNKLREYNRRFSGEPRPILDYIMDFPVLVRHMFRNFFSVSGLVIMLRLRIVMYLLIVVIYILSPFDIIPEAVLGILGFFDDIVIAAVIILYLTILFRQSLANQ